MDSTPVNWETLDSLIIDFAKAENLIEDWSPSSSPSLSPSSPSSSVSSSSYHSRFIILQIRRCLESGDIDAGLDLLRLHAPFILDDHRVLFRLQKQKFIELLRRGTEDARESAIGCLRTALAPCALDAYPEAYEEFKHVLLALIYDKEDLDSPVAGEWSEKRRFDIAGLMSSVLRAHLHAYDPVLVMTLRYLTSIHKAFCFHEGVSSPISDLTERLLLEERDPPGIPQESFYEAPPFDEVDIQALAHAVELTRQGAVDSLKFAKGDLFLAFQNDLCRMKVDASMLDELVREYCVYRGIVDCGLTPPSDDTIKHPRGEASSDANMYSSPENNLDLNGLPGTEAQLRYASELTKTSEVCSTSESLEAGISKVLQRSRNYTVGERSKRKRWRGRQDDPEYVSFSGYSKQEINSTDTSTHMSIDQQAAGKCNTSNLKNEEDKYEIMLRIKELARRGMTSEVVEEINTLDPNFFSQNPILLFQLKQVEFLKLAHSGDHSSALTVASSHLGPLANSHPSFLKPLKETLSVLLRPNEDQHGKGLPLPALATSIQVAIGRRLGIEEPQLMKIMRATLYTHNEWFKLQRCKDRFESLLRIDSLKGVDAPLLSACTMSKSNTDSCTQGSSQVTISSSARLSEDGSSPTYSSSRDGSCDENAIVKIMEFLALPRAEAISLLAQYNGNAESAIQQLFQ